jgi:hypothetical protein
MPNALVLWWSGSKTLKDLGARWCEGRAELSVEKIWLFVHVSIHRQLVHCGMRLSGVDKDEQ